jgi:hypothetical protein
MPETMRPQTDNLISELKEWADAEHGRKAELSRIFGITRQGISDWFARRSNPTSEQTLSIIAFLEDPKKFRKPGRGLAK